MAAKKLTKARTKQPATDASRVTVGGKEKSRAALLAELAYDPAARSLAIANGFLKPSSGDLGLVESLDALMVHVREVKGGNLENAERTLVAQANTLDAIFNELARRAALNMATHLNATETYLRLARKAQSQCRSTLEALAEIKNPRPVSFVRQANIAHGPQQVNNGTAPRSDNAPRARESENRPNELLEQEDGERLDTGTQGSAGKVDLPVATVEKVHRPQNSRR